MSNSYTFQTNLLHNNHKVDPATGAVSVPIQHASTFHQADIDSFGKYDYARSGNPTREALEDVIAQLEEGTRGFAFASGMAAISTAFMLLSLHTSAAATPYLFFLASIRILFISVSIIRSSP